MATEAIELDKDAFMRLVTQEHLDVKGPSGWWLYAGKQGTNGWELYKTRASPNGWLWQARRIATQANVAGGKVLIDIAIPTGTVAKLVSLSVANSGTNSAYCYLLDEDNGQCGQLAAVGSGAGTNYNLPSIGGTSATSGNIQHGLAQLIGPGMKLSIQQAGAGAQSDTMAVGIVLLLSTDDGIPTWSIARSTNPGDVTLAASTISTDNTLQAVYL